MEFHFPLLLPPQPPVQPPVVHPVEVIVIDDNEPELRPGEDITCTF